MPGIKNLIEAHGERPTVRDDESDGLMITLRITFDRGIDMTVFPSHLKVQIFSQSSSVAFRICSRASAAFSFRICPATPPD